MQLQQRKLQSDGSDSTVAEPRLTMMVASPLKKTDGTNHRQKVSHQAERR